MTIVYISYISKTSFIIKLHTIGKKSALLFKSISDIISENKPIKHTLAGIRGDLFKVFEDSASFDGSSK